MIQKLRSKGYHRLHAVSGPGAAGDPGWGQRHELSKVVGMQTEFWTCSAKPGAYSLSGHRRITERESLGQFGLWPWVLSETPFESRFFCPFG